MTSDICDHGILADACVPCAAAIWRAEDAKGEVLAPMPRRLTGGSSSYYTVLVVHPTSGGKAYTVECNDVIEALNMEYDVANAFKAAWRIAALRQGKGKPGQDNPTYDAEKIVFFGNRIIERAK